MEYQVDVNPDELAYTHSWSSLEVAAQELLPDEAARLPEAKLQCNVVVQIKVCGKLQLWSPPRMPIEALHSAARSTSLLADRGRAGHSIHGK